MTRWRVWVERKGERTVYRVVLNRFQRQWKGWEGEEMRKESEEKERVAPENYRSDEQGNGCAVAVLNRRRLLGSYFKKGTRGSVVADGRKKGREVVDRTS